MLDRHLEPILRDALADRPVVLIQGGRQTGKSTLARSISRPGTYTTLDDSATLAAALASPDAFVRSGRHEPFVIDEVQRAPDLLRAIKLTVDEDRRPGRFLLTGSANVLSMPRVSESLAGRMEVQTLQPLSQGEIDGVKGNFIDAAFARTFPLNVPPRRGLPLAERVARGGYPEVVALSAPRRPGWFSSYLSAVLQRDVRSIIQIEDLTALPRIVRLLASRLGGLLNHADIARSLGLPQTSVKRYIALLEVSYLCSFLPAWSVNRGLRLSKAPKVLFNDTGLACSQLGVAAPDFGPTLPILGPLVENFMIMELMKQAAWSKAAPAFHHLRTHAGAEVDLVLEGPAGTVVGVEIKSGRTLSNQDFKGLRELSELAGERFRRGMILYDGDQPLPFGDNLFAVPMHTVWSAR